MKNQTKSLLRILGLITVVGAVLAYVAFNDAAMAKRIADRSSEPGPVSIQTDLVQDKVLTGSEGQVSVSLTLTAMETAPDEHRSAQLTDLVIVLDRSGSMDGAKIMDARQAVEGLVDRLNPNDRLALVSYAHDVHIHFPLVAMGKGHRQQVNKAVQQIVAGGGTNLGGGLRQGIQTLMQAPGIGRQRKLILISDGLANQGVTDPDTLGRMASQGLEHNFSISTVGVGYDFNEILMTAIADRGSGRYHYMENPNAFAQIFDKELTAARNIAASALELRVPLAGGVRLVHAGGYPIRHDENNAVIHPGDLMSGQQRKMFLTFQVPTDRKRRFDLGAFQIRYTHNAKRMEAHSQNDFILACVADEKAVMSSIDAHSWADQIIKEDYSQLQEEVAAAIRKGRKDDALVRILDYELRNSKVNQSVGSAKVTQNLEMDLQKLRRSVVDTFAGAPEAVAEKKKMRSKALQYESYQNRRDQN